MTHGTGRRVAITGMGTVNPCGGDVAVTWANLCAGMSGIGPITRFDASELTTRIAGEVKGLAYLNGTDEKERDRMDLFTLYALAAARESLADANIDPTRLSQAERDRFGVAIGSGIGGLNTIARSVAPPRTARRMSAFFYPSALINMACGFASIRWGFRGPNSAVSGACATGVLAIGDAFRWIQHGYADRAIAGGSDAVLNPLGIGGFTAMRALSSRNEGPELASRPFDQARDGFVISEGAAIVVLEEMSLAIARGATIYAEVVGFSSCADALHITSPAPSGEGAARAIRLALEDAQIRPEQVGYVNAHATSTRVGDIAEANAIRAVFRDHCSELKVSATKSMTGHLLGAAGALETILVALVGRTKVVPPTINVAQLDSECELDVTPNVAGRCDTEYLLNNSFGFGGINACLALRAA